MTATLRHDDSSRLVSSGPRTGAAEGDTSSAETGRRLPADLGDAPLQEAALRLAAGELERALVLRARLVCPAEAAEQVGSRGVEVLVPVQFEPVDEGEASPSPVHLGDGDRAVSSTTAEPVIRTSSP